MAIRIVNEVSNTMAMARNPYKTYMLNHTAGVRRAWDEKLKRLVMQDEEYKNEVPFIYNLIAVHDESKYDPEEWDAYYDHFYGDGGNKSDYTRAWNRHIKLNPHHWQFWITTKDGKETIKDMEFKYIIEMIADWSSFQYMGKGTANDWYNTNKDRIRISKNTRAIVEKYLKLDPTV